MSKTAPDLTAAARPLAHLFEHPRWSRRERFGRFLDDVLADLTGGRKDDPPPAGALSRLRELGAARAGAVAGAPFEDVLGPLFLERVCRGDRRYRGPFFTPGPVARPMAELAGPDGDRGRPRPDGALRRLLEPASGSGVSPLAFLETLVGRAGQDAARGWRFTAIDLDRRRARMTAAQVLANAFIHRLPLGELVVYHGDALGPASELAVLVHATAPDLPPDTVAPARHPSRLEALRAAAAGRGRDLFGLPLSGAPLPDPAGVGS